ncbi:hypothetical protein EZS27_024868 [termite gut metagenome]|uniref:Uncharacterized protein n=1 Tax=termite gut metagenome TaxID=433724 RepID=A0A5J4QWS9_9ZZZZ
MNRQNEYRKIWNLKAEELLPGVSVDSVIFGFHEGCLYVLLNRFENHAQWMLPGGFVRHDENVDDAAYRVLKLRTGLNNVYLQQFYLFGDKDRTNIKENEKFLQENNINLTDSEQNPHWLLKRHVSVGYYAFVEYAKVNINSKLDEVKWFMINQIPPLYSDHNAIINKAISTIRIYRGYIPFCYELLPKRFTMSELRGLYEAILGKNLDRRNFQRKILSLGILEELEEKTKRFGVKITTLFSFDKKKLNVALKYGLLHFEGEKEAEVLELISNDR